MADVIEDIQREVGENKVVLYMKGTPSFPMCGFSAATPRSSSTNPSASSTTGSANAGPSNTAGDSHCGGLTPRPTRCAA